MNKEKYIEDIAAIKNIMNKSTRFISLSGLSGVMAGIYALIGSVVGYQIITTQPVYRNSFQMEQLISGNLLSNTGLMIISTALIVALLSVITAYFLTLQKARKHQQKVWSSQSKRLVLNFILPLITGGAFVIILIDLQLIGLVAPAMLIFYGLACTHASKHTLGTVKYLGISCIILGLLNTQFIGYGLYFWALGFGVCHILYGSIMYYKYDKQ